MCALGISLGIGIAAIELVPLAAYLCKSPVWSDRARERAPVWRITRPRLIDSVCTVFPYAFGSQRRGHPNLAKAVGAHNLNEAAGGFGGLATCAVLAPAGIALHRRNPRIAFLAALGTFGAFGAFELPPVANLLRAAPVLSVMDHRRLTLWVAFALIALGGFGLDGVCEIVRSRLGRWLLPIGLAGAILFVGLAVSVRGAESALRARAAAHYAAAAAQTPGADVSVYQARAERQVRQTLEFVPRYAIYCAANLSAVTALVFLLRRRRIAEPHARLGFMALVLVDVLSFGYGLNPAVACDEDRPESAVIAYLRREAPPPARILAVGAELPPNILMRYGLADIRNYDSVELTRSLDRFPRLYEPGHARTSRRSVTWEGVIRSRAALEAAGVSAVVGACRPPAGVFPRVDGVGNVWIARISASNVSAPYVSEHGCIRVDVAKVDSGCVVVPETYDPGWKAEVDARPVAVSSGSHEFLQVVVPRGAKTLLLRYDPWEVRFALVVSLAACAATCLAFAGKNPVRMVEKSRLWSWKASRNRVRIESVISSPSCSPASH